MKKLIVTGASGFLGANFCREQKDEFEIHAVYFHTPVEMAGIRTHKADLTNEDEVKALFAAVKPDAVLHLAALSDPNYCEEHKEESVSVNIEAAENMAMQAMEHGCRMVFASTDLVFDGKHAPYTEKDLPVPVSIYGMHKAIAEEAVRDINKEFVVCRLPLMFGQNFTPYKSFIQPMMEKLGRGEEIKLFKDEYRTPAAAKDICNGLALALEKGYGIIHLGGPERLSRLQMGEILCEVFGFDKKLLVPGLQKDVKMAAPRPKDVSLDSRKAEDELGWQAKDFREALTELYPGNNI
jgi:dTDP-4-dehydrorhamnose reductase